MPYVKHTNYTIGAKYYDLREKYKNYKAEVGWVKERIKEWKKSKGKKLLDVGCGTGGHLVYLENDFKCTGFDLHQQMVDIAKKKLKKTRLLQGDMETFDLGEKFDVIICLYSVINYAKNYAHLRKTLQNLYNHLEKGGVIIIEPYYTSKIYKNFSGKSKVPGLLMNDPERWLKIMKEIGFKMKYFYAGLCGVAKGAYVGTKELR